MRHALLLVLAGCPWALEDNFRIAEDGGSSVAPPADACTDCTPWSAIAPSTLGAREKAAWCTLSDGRIFVWGGADDKGKESSTGAIYDAPTDAWTSVPPAPLSPRVLATAVCTPSYVIVWGGGDLQSTADLKDGAILDLKKMEWKRQRDHRVALNPRRAPVGGVVESSALFWSGFTKSGSAAGGSPCALDPSANTWTQGAAGPAALLAPGADMGANALWVFGGASGSTELNEVWRFKSNGWTSISAPGISARQGAFAGWDGARFVVWGGATGGVAQRNGATFTDPSGPWRPISAVAAPSARARLPRQSGWVVPIIPNKTLIVSGTQNGSFAHDGALYDATADTWTTIPAWPSNEDHQWGVVAWTGKTLVVWGGRTGESVSSTGERVRLTD